MNRVEELITDALGTTGVPVARDYYSGKEDVFLIYAMLHASDEIYADGRSLGRFFDYEVEVVSRENPRETVQAVIQSLKSADFYRVRVVNEAYEERLGMFHVFIEGSYTEVR